MGSGQLDGFNAASRLQGLVTMRLEKIVEQLHIEFIILDDQDTFLHVQSAPRQVGESSPICGDNLTFKSLSDRDLRKANSIGETWGDLPMKPISGVSREAAEALAIEALGFLAAEPERLDRFMTLCGLSPDTLRTAASSPGFLGAVLNHLTQDDALLIAFAETAGCDPKLILTARNCLDPPAESWP
jgi:hypothetical protein